MSKKREEEMIRHQLANNAKEIDKLKEDKEKLIASLNHNINHACEMCGLCKTINEKSCECIINAHKLIKELNYKEGLK